MMPKQAIKQKSSRGRRQQENRLTRWWPADRDISLTCRLAVAMTRSIQTTRKEKADGNDTSIESDPCARILRGSNRQEVIPFKLFRFSLSFMWWRACGARSNCEAVKYLGEKTNRVRANRMHVRTGRWARELHCTETLNALISGLEKAGSLDICDIDSEQKSWD